MDCKLFLYLFLLPLFNVTHVDANHCQVNDDHDCESYKVVCDGGIDNLQRRCDGSAYVIFQIENHDTDELSSDFFRSTSSSFDSTVREMNGVNNNWYSLESNLFRYYSRTVKMDFSGNHIKIINNNAFQGLTNLKSLNLSRNEIEKLTSHSLLISDGRTTSLNVLDLSYNRIESVASDTFQQLPDLTTLYLNNNKLITLDDNSFIGLNNLVNLSLGNNEITALNSVLNRLHALKNIDISFNNLKRLSGYETIHLDSLETFNASYNAIETVESNCFNQALVLRTLDLSCNKIRSSIESVMFINNNKLSYLNLYNNSITVIQPSAFKHNNLSYLNLDNNILGGIIGEYTFSDLLISSLNFSNYGIVTIKDFAFSDSPYLSYLNLSHNIISTIEEHAMDSLPSLKTLDVSSNDITNVIFLQNCCFNLTELNLRDNKLETLPKNILHEHMYIVNLDISMNNIAVIEQNSLPLNNLQYLSIGGNLLGGPIESGVFSPAKYMRALDLSNMNFTEIYSGAFVDLPLLARLNLSHNQISRVDTNNFVGLRNLYMFDISYNNLSTLDTQDSLAGVKSLYLNNNNFKSISSLIEFSHSLQYLDTSYNNIEDITDTPFDNSPNLQSLYLMHNKIKTFNNQHTNKLNSLVDLRLSSNQIDQLDLTFFKNLTSLDFGDNGLTYLNSSLLKNAKQLQYLDVSRNKIKDLPPGTFHNITGIKVLNISSNELTKLRFGSLKDLHNTVVLDISRNKIEKLDPDVFHECTSLKTLIIDYNKITALNTYRFIEVLTKLEIISLGGNEMTCGEILREITDFEVNSAHHVTSVDKVFHEDNVHGIKCLPDKDDNPQATTTQAIPVNAHYITQRNLPEPRSETTIPPSTSGYTALTVWCSLLTIAMIAVLGIGYFYNKNRRSDASSVGFDRHRLSNLEMRGTDYDADLLN